MIELAVNAEQRVLILAPTGRDSELAIGVFRRAGIQAVGCAGIAELCAELARGAAAVLLAEEAVVQDRPDCLADWIGLQPAWSDLPVLVLARPGASSALVARAMHVLGNVTVLERPTRMAALVSATRAALRARQRQYQIREHIARFELAQIELRANDRRKDEFLAILAHELRNPLAPIRNALHVLRLRNSGDANFEQCEEIMERQLRHLVRLVDDLLEVSRITRGKVSLRRERVDLAAALNSALEASRPLIESAGHVLSVSIPPEPLTLDADPVRLAQVFTNLLNNAARYTEPAGHIWLEVRRDGAEVTISVRDDGAGIPEAMLARIFDLFTQVDRGSRGKGGLGIGLTLVKSLVEMHGGTVLARSGGPGLGSEFTVRLPLAPEVAEVVHAQDARPAAAVTHRRVVVVDDNRDAADTLGLVLRTLGADVRVAYDGPEGLKTFSAWPPDVVLLDIGLPGMDGHEVARRVRKLPGGETVLLVALTGWGNADEVRRSREAGFDHHLVKPADVATLQALLGAGA